MLANRPTDRPPPNNNNDINNHNHVRFFPCHFKGDQVMAGSLVSDGCSQLLKLYMVWLGLHKKVAKADLSASCEIDWQFRPVNGIGNKVCARVWVRGLASENVSQ